MDSVIDPEKVSDELFPLARAIHRYGIAQARREEKLDKSVRDDLITVLAID